MRNKFSGYLGKLSKLAFASRSDNVLFRKTSLVEQMLGELTQMRKILKVYLEQEKNKGIIFGKLQGCFQEISEVNFLALKDSEHSKKSMEVVGCFKDCEKTKRELETLISRFYVD